MIDLPKNNAVVRNLGKKYKLVPYLEKAISQFQDPWEFKYEEKAHDCYWHPSAHCLPDASDLYDMAVNPQHYEEETGNGLQKAYQVGHFWHQFLQYIIVNKLKFAEQASIERRAFKWWGDPVRPSFDAESKIAEGCTEYFADKYRKEDLYYQRYPEQTFWDGSEWKHAREFTDEYRAAPDLPEELIRVLPDDDLGIAKIRPKDWHMVAGSADVCPLVCPSWEGLLDIKTMGSQMYKKAETGMLPFAEKYECQLQTYMALFDVPQCMLLAVNKDTPHSFQEFYFERDDELIETLFGKWEFVAACIDLGEPPVKEDDRAFALPELRGPIAA